MTDPTPPSPTPWVGTPAWYRRPWVGWVAGGLVGLLVGLGLGLLVDGDEPDDATVVAEGQPSPEASRTPTPTASGTADPDPGAGSVDASGTDQPATATETADGDPAPVETVTVTETAAPAPAETVTVTETTTAAPPATGGDVLTAGQYEFADVQVRQDDTGAFEVLARVTNTGESYETVMWTATIFLDGSVVATAEAVANQLEGGSTTTQTFISTDDYVEGAHTVEFQVDGEF